MRICLPLLFSACFADDFNILTTERFNVTVGGLEITRWNPFPEGTFARGGEFIGPQRSLTLYALPARDQLQIGVEWNNVGESFMMLQVVSKAGRCSGKILYIQRLNADGPVNVPMEFEEGDTITVFRFDSEDQEILHDLLGLQLTVACRLGVLDAIHNL